MSNQHFDHVDAYEFANEEYVEANFHGKCRDVSDAHMTSLLVALFRYLQSRPESRNLALVLFALGYFVFPLDAVPDAAPFVGFTDDLMVVVAVVRALGPALAEFLDA